MKIKIPPEFVKRCDGIKPEICIERIIRAISIADEMGYKIIIDMGDDFMSLDELIRLGEELGQKNN